MAELYSKDVISKLIEEAQDLNEFKAKLDEVPEEDAILIEPLDIEEGEAIIVSFPPERMEPVPALSNFLQTNYPNNPVIGIVNDIDLLIENADEALALLDNMKAKISILKDTDGSKKIII
jgi:hypothetical protein